jgi:nicotinate dehydrogenase subunit A
MKITLLVNEKLHDLEVTARMSLLTVLRNDLKLNGPKYGCGLGQCGACTVLVDGVAARACVFPAMALQGHAILTLEGLGMPAGLHPVQQAFIAQNAAQCGYCLNGMLLTIVALLHRNAAPTASEIRQELRYNLCRCGAHVEILAAASQAAAALNGRLT